MDGIEHSKKYSNDSGASISFIRKFQFCPLPHFTLSPIVPASACKNLLFIQRRRSPA